MKFWLGLHHPKDLERTDVPACVSYGTLRHRRRLPRPRGEVFLDSRGFSEIAAHGEYTFGAGEYADFARRLLAGGWDLRHASVMDWMCEPAMLVRTGLSVAEHQRRTTHSYLVLKSLAPEVPWVPVLQGWVVGDYLRHLGEYGRALPLPLRGFRLVGLGSVCRRQGMAEAGSIVRALYAEGMANLHGFGFKVTGLVGAEELARYLKSSDSMAWSRDGRWAGGNGANSLAHALAWRERLVARVERVRRQGTQQLMF